MTDLAHNMTQNDTGLSEKRSCRRRRVLKSATIHFNKGYASYQCLVRNMGDKGVMVEMEETGGLPSHFDFRLSGENTPVPAELVWKNSKRVGIAFLS